MLLSVARPLFNICTWFFFFNVVHEHQHQRPDIIFMFRPSLHALSDGSTWLRGSILQHDKYHGRLGFIWKPQRRLTNVRGIAYQQYWRGVSLWKNVSKDDFLRYRWQVWGPWKVDTHWADLHRRYLTQSGRPHPFTAFCVKFYPSGYLWPKLPLHSPAKTSSQMSGMQCGWHQCPYVWHLISLVWSIGLNQSTTLFGGNLYRWNLRFWRTTLD